MTTNELKNEAISKIKYNQVPLEIFESIPNHRHRKDFMNLVFQKENFSSNHNQNLKLHFALIDYFDSVIKFKLLGLILVFSSIIFLIFSQISSPKNLDNSLLTLIEGVLIFILFQNILHVRKFALYACISLVFLLIIEFPLLGFPTEIIENHSLQILRSKSETIVAILNSASPYIYLSAKLIIVAYSLIIYYSTMKFTAFKHKFETAKL